MDIHFEPIIDENRHQAEMLSLFPEQCGFIESVRECLAEADEVSEWKCVGIYDADTLVGFAMYGKFKEPLPYGEVWLDRLLIDKKYQRCGYGKTAVTGLLKKLRNEYNCPNVRLSVYDTNTVAVELYKKIGFRFNGELDTKGEKVMIYEF